MVNLLEEYTGMSPLPPERRPMLGYLPYTAESEFEFSLVVDRYGFMKHKPCGQWVGEVHRCHYCMGKENCCG